MARPRRRGAWIALGLLLAAAPAGCVERRYTIRTDPPGALVIVNQEELGVSPVSKSFTFYGDRDVQIVKEGYQTQRFVQPIKAPWWDNVITEFFTENIVPITLRDEREFTYGLAPATSPAASDLLGRGELLRADAQVNPPPRRKGLLGWLGF